ncbi:Hypothetical protein PHPALM_585 [Phytophthora palmivora]|uniref:Uncharacterized protein n=1 Tax=Phytophthora palmivora TaxID=4796 RepID=A0A2P4YUF5_9STRA|nr:Hypothetical protein PHPALM_585 [Phytophthora palmivora]
MQFEVNHILISSRNAGTNGMLRMVKKLDETHQTKTGVSVRKRADFNYLKGCQAIEHVQISNVPAEFRSVHARSSRREAYTFLGSFFDFESTQLIRATGALLLYLSTEKVNKDGVIIKQTIDY